MDVFNNIPFDLPSDLKLFNQSPQNRQIDAFPVNYLHSTHSANPGHHLSLQPSGTDNTMNFNNTTDIQNTVPQLMDIDLSFDFSNKGLHSDVQTSSSNTINVDNLFPMDMPQQNLNAGNHLSLASLESSQDTISMFLDNSSITYDGASISSFVPEQFNPPYAVRRDSFADMLLVEQQKSQYTPVAHSKLGMIFDAEDNVMTNSRSLNDIYGNHIEGSLNFFTQKRPPLQAPFESKNAKGAKSMPILSDNLNNGPQLNFSTQINNGGNLLQNSQTLSSGANLESGFFDTDFDKLEKQVDLFQGSPTDIDLDTPISLQFASDSNLDSLDPETQGILETSSSELQQIAKKNDSTQYSISAKKLDFNINELDLNLDINKETKTRKSKESSNKGSKKQNTKKQIARPTTHKAEVQQEQVLSSRPLLANQPPKYINFFQKTMIDKKRYQLILEYAQKRNLNVGEVEKVLMLFSNSYTGNKYALAKENFGILSKVKIICGLIEYQSNSNARHSNNNYFKKVLSKFPIIENQGGIHIQIKSSCGKEGISDADSEINSTEIDNVLQLLQSEDYNLNLLENLAEFDIFKNLMGEDNPSCGNENYIKRPLNSYMLYRSSMIKVAAVLTMLQVLNDLILSYYNDFATSGFFSHFEFNEALLLKMIEFDLNEMMNGYGANNGSNFVSTQREEVLHQLLANSTYHKHTNSQIAFSVLKSYASFPAVSNRIRKLQNYRIVENFKDVKINHGIMCHVIALLWLTEQNQIKDQFAEFSKIEKLIHEETYPDYKFNPKKKKKGVEESSNEANTFASGDKDKTSKKSKKDASTTTTKSKKRSRH